MEKKLTKNEKGITLVALIITIIILLILAVVSIRAITGDNILGKAEKAKEKYESAKGNELNVLKDYSNNIEQEKLDTKKVLNKAYVSELQDGEVIIYSIVNENNNVKFSVKQKSGENVQEQLSMAVKLVTSFEPIYVYIGEEKIDITPENACEVVIEGNESDSASEKCYILENYLFPGAKKGNTYSASTNISSDGNFNYLIRNESYDIYTVQ